MSWLSKRWRTAAGIAGVFLLVFAAFLAYFWFTAWKPLEEYAIRKAVTAESPILNGAQYEDLIDSHARPFLVRASVGGSQSGAVLIYGAEHTRDPNEPSVAEIEAAFRDFQPTVALCEGRMTGLLFPQLMNPMLTFGEPGLVRGLAYQHGCRVYTWEPPPSVEVSGLMDQGFTAEQIALRLILSSYFSNRRFGKPNNPEKVVAESLRKKSGWPSIGNVFDDVEAIDAAWRKFLPDGPDWREVSDQFGLPGFLGEMDANLVRDQHLFQIMMELVADGERVFVIAGSSHAVKLDAAVTSTVNKLAP